MPRARILLAAAAALLLTIAILDAHRALDCDIPPGESCATDTECQCMHGGDGYGD